MIDIDFSNEQTYTDIEFKGKVSKKKDTLTDQELYEYVKYEKRLCDAMDEEGEDYE